MPLKNESPASKAIKTDKWTQILFDALTPRVAKRWKFVSFRGPKGRESAGIVDTMAIRRNTRAVARAPLKENDLFEIILVQLKGGSAKKPKLQDRRRLWAAMEHYGALDVVLFTWKKGKGTTYERLDSKLDWQMCKSPKEIFGY